MCCVSSSWITGDRWEKGGSFLGGVPERGAIEGIAGPDGALRGPALR